MSEQTVLSSPDLLLDLEIIALGQPGKGPALKRCLERAGMTQRELATKLGYDKDSESGRTTVTQWCNEVRWPPAGKVREIMVHCNIDRKLLLDKFGVSLTTEISPAGEARALLVTLRNELMFEFDEFERREAIFRNTAEKVLLFQAFKAFDDTKAAQLFFERYDKHQEESRRRRQSSTRDVSPSQATWMANPYDKKPPANSDTPADTQVPEDKDTPTTTET